MKIKSFEDTYYTLENNIPDMKKYITKNTGTDKNAYLSKQYVFKQDVYTVDPETMITLLNIIVDRPRPQQRLFPIQDLSKKIAMFVFNVYLADRDIIFDYYFYYPNVYEEDLGMLASDIIPNKEV